MVRHVLTSRRQGALCVCSPVGTPEGAIEVGNFCLKLRFIFLCVYVCVFIYEGKCAFAHENRCVCIHLHAFLWRPELYTWLFWERGSLAGLRLASLNELAGH